MGLVRAYDGLVRAIDGVVCLGCGCEPVFTQGCAACEGTQAILSIQIRIADFTGVCAVMNGDYDMEQLLSDGSVNPSPSPTACRFWAVNRKFGHPVFDTLIIGTAGSDTNWYWSGGNTYSSTTAFPQTTLSSPHAQPYDCTGLIGETNPMLTTIGFCDPADHLVASVTILGITHFYP